MTARGLGVGLVVLGVACSTSYGGADSPSPAEGGTSTVRDAKKCDPEKVADCIALPLGWTLVAITEESEPPACPEGFDRPSELGADPVPRADACDCGRCNVTQNAECEGVVASYYGASNSCPNSDAPYYANSPGGACLTDLFAGTFAPFEKFAPPPAVGGACVNDVVRGERVDWTKRVRICEDASRCSGSTCDGFVATPYRACIANAIEGGDASCPSAFPTKHTVGTTAMFDCSAGCACTVERGACAGSITHYMNSDCTGAAVTTMLDNVCRNTGLGNTTWKSYRVQATTVTTCTGSGASAASNPRVVRPRTICCR